ncbi:hypothetical protein A1232T_00102 [Psychrobacter piechaudii]|uniref:Uncharacterized protein n=1 Tax=Psychrobacter piechaudii TaxID=1945521 RepID=A0A1R4GAH7_9GAMM|nr:hypothetical protein A1232T_00102 [Psychrobacter piechaudii]
MKKFPRFVIYCLLTPSVGALIFNLYLLISIQFNSESVFAIPDDFLSSVLLPIVGSPLLGLLYFIPALLTYVFAEILLVQVKNKRHQVHYDSFFKNSTKAGTFSRALRPAPIMVAEAGLTQSP